jgi:N-acetylneuraminate synthase
MNHFKIGKKGIGGKNPCFVIAEAGANYRISENKEENFAQALRLIGIAASAGADAVKFQLYTAKRLYAERAGEADYIGKKKSINAIIEEMELPVEWLPLLKKNAEEKGLVFLCSPFDEQGADELEKIGIEAFKIASYTISHVPLLKHIARKGKPVILSVGASDWKDIEKAVKVIKKEGNSGIALLQCTAKYPAPLSTVNLRAIPAMGKKFGLATGLSDHSREPLIAPLGAVALGAKIIEKHFTTDNNSPGPDHGFAILPQELKEMVSGIRKMEQALGSAGKKVLAEEKELHRFCRRSIYALENIPKGAVLSGENVAVLRPGKRERVLEPEEFEKMLGKKAKRDIAKGGPVKKGDF